MNAPGANCINVMVVRNTSPREITLSSYQAIKIQTCWTFHTVDGRTPAPPKQSWNDDSLVNTNNQWLPMVSKCCEMEAGARPRLHRREGQGGGRAQAHQAEDLSALRWSSLKPQTASGKWRPTTSNQQHPTNNIHPTTNNQQQQPTNNIQKQGCPLRTVALCHVHVCHSFLCRSHVVLAVGNMEMTPLKPQTGA